jgi:hypothetical protein
MEMDDNTETKSSSLSADIGIGLKAEIQVKAEIPKEVTGDLVAALTDIIRPFTEARGLKADQIRLQREDVLLEITKKARIRADIEKIELHPVPTKLLVPFLEKASLEDFDKEMQDYWASLLLSSSKEYQAMHLTFVDMLSRMSSNELKLLEEVYFSHDKLPKFIYPTSHFNENHYTIRHKAEILSIEVEISESTMQWESSAKVAYDEFVNSVMLIYGRIMHAGVTCFVKKTTGEGDSDLEAVAVFFYNERYDDTSELSSIQILERERLLDTEVYTVPIWNTEIQYFNLTPLGIDFVLHCSPRASAAAFRK